MVWKLYSGSGTGQDLERVQGLTNLRSPQATGELQQFLCAVYWMRSSLPHLVEASEPETDQTGGAAQPHFGRRLECSETTGMVRGACA